MAKTALQLREARADLIQKAQLFNSEKADGETGVLSAEDQGTFDKMLADAQALGDQAKSLSLLEEQAADLKKVTRPAPAIDPQGGAGGAGDSARMIKIRDGFGKSGEIRYREVEAGERGSEEYEAAFSSYLRNGATAQNVAALQSDDSEQAGFLIASEQLAAGILQEVDDLLFVRQHAKIHTVREADSLGIRKRTGRANTFDWSDELTLGAEDTGLKYGKKVLTPHHLTGQIKVSRDLVRRSMEGIDGIVRGEMARDSGEKMEDAYLTGNGNKQPLGVFTPSDDGVSTDRDFLTGSNTGFTFAGLTAAKYSLKSQYRNGGSRPGARWLFHRDGISKLAQLVDLEGHPLLHPGRGLLGDEFDVLLGYPVDESERSPNTFTAGLYVGMLCNWSYYEIADALDLEIQVLLEAYATTNQIGYIGRMKTDGMPTLEEAFVRLKTGTT